MFNKINILLIIKAHLKTLRNINDRNSDIYWRDIITYFFLPLITSTALTYNSIDIAPQVSNLIAIISIFGGFLFNLLAIIYTYIDKIKSESEKTPSTTSKIKKRFAVEINSNIAFCIVLSIFSVLLLLLYSFIPTSFLQENFYFKNSLLLTIYFLLILFFLTLLMVLTRVFILLQRDNDD